MKTRKSKVLLVGALPPPYIGPSVANARLFEAEPIRSQFDVIVADISDRRNPGNIGKFDLMNSLLAFYHIFLVFGVLLRKRPNLLYLGVSQGIWGYVRDLGFVVPALLLRKRVVVHLRGSEFDLFYEEMPSLLQWVTRKVFKRVARVVVLGPGLKRCFKGLVPEHRIEVVPNGISSEVFDASPVTERKASDGRNVLFLSSMKRRKGILILLEAIPLVLKRYPDARFTLCGEWKEDHTKRKGLEMVEDLDMRGVITFSGEVSGDEKHRAYQEHDLFVFTPIEPEGLPWVVLEAMSSRLPVISSRQGAIPDVIEDGITGYLIVPTAENLADRICTLMEHPDQARSMGQSGRDRVERLFGEEEYFRAMGNVFSAALADASTLATQ